MPTQAELFAKVLAGQQAGASDTLIPPPRNLAAPAPWAEQAVQGTAKKLADLLMLPGKAMQQGITTEEAIPWAADVGMGMVGTPGTPAGALGSSIKPIRAYHGSPHDFDRFDLSKIGTGEGAQAYGHGLYFAENPEVARDYREVLSGNRGLEPVDLATNMLYHHRGNYETAIAELEGRAANADPALLAKSHIPDAISILRNRDPLKGRMYEVNINAEPQQFLDWDKPLAQQPNVAEIAKNLPNPIVKAWTENGAFPHVSGSSLYDTIGMRGQNSGMAAGNAGGRAYATDALREAGIPGIKYLDQGSRTPLSSYSKPQLENQLATLRTDLANAEAQGIGEPDRMRQQIASLENQLSAVPDPTHNYVLFDDKIIDILRKYGIAGAAPTSAALADALARNQNEPIQQ